ncbi:MAG: sigma-54-dependent Fis family transcriptional regulator [Fibrobacteres bacterium]|nr:sigma-54-dependent Fis family transcriptional regulator [Fibrobacterota bacterium]
MSVLHTYIENDLLKPELLNLAHDRIFVLLDEKGSVIDSTANAIHLNSLNYLLMQVKKIRTIHEMFDIKDGRDIPGLAWSLDQFPSKIEPVSLRSDVYCFDNEPEEYYSLIPTANLRIFKQSTNRYLGVIRMIPYFVKYIAENFRQPVMGLDAKGKLISYNRAFRQAVTGGHENLLGRNISELISPTPAKLQLSAQDDIGEISTYEWKNRYKMNFSIQGSSLKGLIAGSTVKQTAKGLHWTNEERKDFLLTIDTPVNWDRENVRLTVRLSNIQNYFPCMVVGEKLKTRSEWGDIDGYIVGPTPEGRALYLKKQTLPVFHEKMNQLEWQDGEYTFYYVNRTFMIYKGQEKIFSYTDFEGVSSGKRWISLWLIEEQQCCVEYIELSVSQAVNESLIEKQFVTFEGQKGKYFLPSSLGSHYYSVEDQYYGFYKLQEMTGIKERFDALQLAHETALRKEREALLQLRDYREEQNSLIGNGKAMTDLRNKAEKVAKTSATVLITGETGTGKEVLARYIHSKSSRKNQPFIKIDCSALPASLMESILFGHVKGAFTGADRNQKGMINEAQGGTLFIDDVGSLTLDVQAKLLHFLQERTITPLGSSKPIHLDIRILTASNKLLESMIKAGTFREDLYYRLAVIPIHIPPLRDRLEDLSVLSSHFMWEFNHRYGRDVRSISPEAMQKLHLHVWKGNVRELQNVIEQSVIFSRGTEISARDIKFSSAEQHYLKNGRLDISRDDFIKLFRENNGVVKTMAAALNVSRRAIYDYFVKYGMKPNQLRNNPRKQQHR